MWDVRKFKHNKTEKNYTAQMKISLNQIVIPQKDYLDGLLPMGGSRKGVTRNRRKLEKLMYFVLFTHIYLVP